MTVCQSEGVSYDPRGLEALVFTADGDMRQALNNLQSTFSGFGHVNQESVFKVCDQPHPMVVAAVVKQCLAVDYDGAWRSLKQLLDSGYSPVDVVTTLFRVVKNYDMNEFLKLEFIRETGLCHMRVGDGVSSPLQLGGMLARLCRASKVVADKAAGRSG